MQGLADRRYSIRVCRGPECEARDSRAVYQQMRRSLAEHGCAERCDLGWQPCFGRCSQGVNLLVREITPDGDLVAGAPDAPSRATALYNGVDPVNVDDVVQQHVGRGQLVQALIRPAGLLPSMSTGRRDHE